MQHAHVILDWQENLGRDELPPKWMWPFDEELECWFIEVEDKRNEKYGGNGETDSEVSMMDNELTRGRK